MSDRQRLVGPVGITNDLDRSSPADRKCRQSKKKCGEQEAGQKEEDGAAAALNPKP